MANIEVVVGVEPAQSLARRTDAGPDNAFEPGPRLPFGTRHAVRVDEDPNNAVPLCGYQEDLLFVIKTRSWAADYDPAGHRYCGYCASLYEELMQP